MGSTRLFCSFLLLAGGGMAQDLFGYNFEPSTRDDELKGNPKTVRVEREADGRRLLEEQIDYRSDGKLAERRFWKPDGTLSAHQQYEYNDQGRRSRITYLDGKGNKTRTETFRWPDSSTEEELAEQPGSSSPIRTIRRFDQHGRMVELKDSESTATMTYDDQGRP